MYFSGHQEACVYFKFFFQFSNSSGVQLIKLVTMPRCQEGLQGCTGAGCVWVVIQRDQHICSRCLCKSSKNSFPEEVYLMVSEVWVLRCSVLFRKEDTNQLCKGLTEEQDTNSMLCRSWFTFINVKESIFKSLLEFFVLIFDFYGIG